MSDRMISTRKIEQLMSLDREFQDGIGKQMTPAHYYTSQDEDLVYLWSDVLIRLNYLMKLMPPGS